MQPVALDLFKGLGGWTKGLKAAGWFVIGVDNVDYSSMPGYVEPDLFVKADVLDVAKDAKAWVKQYDSRPVQLICASPPCQEFSYSSFPFKKALEKFTKENPPSDKLWRAAESIARQLGAPLVLENVRGAVKWMGKAVNKFGPFYLWGDVPALLPDGKPQKGFGRVRTNDGSPMPNKFTHIATYESRGGRGPLNGKRMVGSEKYRKMAGEYECVNGLQFNQGESSSQSSHSQSRKEWSAKAAMIPPELAEYIGEVFHPDFNGGRK